MNRTEKYFLYFMTIMECIFPLMVIYNYIKLEPEIERKCMYVANFTITENDIKCDTTLIVKPGDDCFLRGCAREMNKPFICYFVDNCAITTVSRGTDTIATGLLVITLFILVTEFFRAQLSHNETPT